MTDAMTVGPFDQTWYCNQEGYDIRKIKPYAAYDVGADEWVVKPPHLPHWSWSELPEPVRAVLRAADTYARRVLKLPEPERTQQGAALFDAWHADRSRAFGPQGEGWWDIANLREKFGDQAGWWAQLVDCKHRYNQGLGAAAPDWSNTPTGYRLASSADWQEGTHPTGLSFREREEQLGDGAVLRHVVSPDSGGITISHNSRIPGQLHYELVHQAPVAGTDQKIPAVRVNWVEVGRGYRGRGWASKMYQAVREAHPGYQIPAADVLEPAGKRLVRHYQQKYPDVHTGRWDGEGTIHPTTGPADPIMRPMMLEHTGYVATATARSETGAYSSRASHHELERLVPGYDPEEHAFSDPSLRRAIFSYDHTRGFPLLDGSHRSGLALHHGVEHLPVYVRDGGRERINWTTKFHRFEPKDLNGLHALHVADEHGWAGSLSWNPQSGTVDNVEVRPDIRRQGLASHLWEQAKKITPHLQHDSDDELTEEGRAWASKIATIAKLPKTQKCDYCEQQATKRVIWAEGMAYIPVCDEHEQRAMDHVGDDYCNTKPIPKTASAEAPYFHGTSIERARSIIENGANTHLNLTRHKDMADDYAEIGEKFHGGGGVLEGDLVGSPEEHHREPWGVVTSRPNAFIPRRLHYRDGRVEDIAAPQGSEHTATAAHRFISPDHEQGYEHGLLGVSGNKSGILRRRERGHLEDQDYLANYCNIKPIPKVSALYHGTDEDLPVGSKLLPGGSINRKNHELSAPDRVYVTPDPGAARVFAHDFARPGHRPRVYEVHAPTATSDNPHDRFELQWTAPHATVHREVPDHEVSGISSAMEDDIELWPAQAHHVATSQLWITPQVVMGSGAGLNHARQVNSASEAVAAVQQGLTAVLPSGAWFPVRQVLLGLGMTMLDVNQRLRQFGAPSSVTG